MKRKVLALVTSTVAFSSANAFAIVAPTSLRLGTSESIYAVLAGKTDATTAGALTQTADGQYPSATEAHLLPEAAYVQVNPMTGKHEIDFMPIYNDSNRIESLVVSLELVTGWSKLVQDDIKKAFPSATQWKMRATTSEFSLHEHLGKNKTRFSTVSFPGGSAKQLNTTGMPVPLQVTITKEGLQNLVCGLEQTRLAGEIEKENGLPPSDFSNPMFLLTGLLKQEYNVLEQDISTEAWAKVSYPHEIKVTLKTSDETSDQLQATQIITDAISDLGLTCKLRDSDLDGQAAKVRDYCQSHKN